MIEHRAREAIHTHLLDISQAFTSLRYCYFVDNPTKLLRIGFDTKFLKGIKMSQELGSWISASEWQEPERIRRQEDLSIIM